MFGGTYALFYLLFDGVDDLVDASPLVLILCATLNHTEALQDVNDVVDSATFYTQLLRALVEVEKATLGCAVQEEKTSTKFTKALLLPIVSCTFLTVIDGRKLGPLSVASNCDRLLGG